MNAMSLPAIHSASLPETYHAALVALGECQRVDECKDWADKAVALASYAKQSQDESLMKMAQRINARATRRPSYDVMTAISEETGGKVALDSWRGPLRPRSPMPDKIGKQLHVDKHEHAARAVQDVASIKVDRVSNGDAA